MTPPTRSTAKKILLTLASLSAATLFCFAAAAVWIAYGDFKLSKRQPADLQTADSALILSTKVYEQGRPNPCLAARVAAGVELWKAGKVKRLVMSGGINRDFHHGSKTMQALAEQMGVPAGAIVQETEADDTFKNIVYSTPLLAADRSVVLVSSGFHMRRAGWLAARQWPDKHIQVYAHRNRCYDETARYWLEIIRETGAVLKNGILDRY